MQSQDNFKKVKMNPFIIAGVLFAVLVVIFLIISLVRIFRVNPYGNETKIDNLSKYYDDLPQEKTDQIFYQLYNMLNNNLPEGTVIPEDGALIREKTAEYTYNESEKIHYGKFVVDIAEVRQSYQVQFEWSPVDNNQNLGGYPVLITCLPTSLQIYPNDYCSNILEVDVSWENAFQLDYTLGTEASYNIRKKIGEYLLSTAEDYNYTVNIDETTLKMSRMADGVILDFKITLNRDQVFDVTVKTDLFYKNEQIELRKSD